MVLEGPDAVLEANHELRELLLEVGESAHLQTLVVGLAKGASFLLVEPLEGLGARVGDGLWVLVGLALFLLEAAVAVGEEVRGTSLPRDAIGVFLVFPGLRLAGVGRRRARGAR